MKELSKNATDLLDYNGYRYKVTDQQVIFRKTSGNVALMVLLVIAGAFLTIFIPVAGLAIIIVAVIRYIWMQREAARGFFVVELDSGRAHLSERILQQGEITAVYVSSKFISEYTSAHKATSKEYRVAIGLETNEDGKIELFRFIADHEKPSKEVMEISEFLKSLVQ